MAVKPDLKTKASHFGHGFNIQVVFSTRRTVDAVVPNRRKQRGIQPQLSKLQAASGHNAGSEFRFEPKVVIPVSGLERRYHHCGVEKSKYMKAASPVNWSREVDSNIELL
ncbi:MAG: hypothetical protein LCH99_26060 [Proteobacteria bacterium]|nr:hypothetical protein [Pseudomonadota bacterium]